MSTENTAKTPELKKIVVEVRKWNWVTNNYEAYRHEVIDEATAQKIIDFNSEKISIEGFYQYHFRVENLVITVHTLNPDLVDFITKIKRT